MATYKLIQDIEAEDHIIGNLSLRQFIYGMIAAFLYYLCFFLVTKGAAFMLILFVPPALFFTFFAFPFGRDQSTEIWALAKLRFLIKPRKRIWDQSGLKELVTITVPKKIEHILTNGLSQGEVRSRLGALANTLDSRGWAVKNVNANAFDYNDPFAAQTSDRLIDISNFPAEVPASDIVASDDIMDETNNPLAHQFEVMITDSEKAYKQQLIDRMNSQTSKPAKQQNTPADYWFMNQPPSSSLPPNQTMFANNQMIRPIKDNEAINLHSAKDVTGQEKILVEKLQSKNAIKQASTANLRTLQPTSNLTRGVIPTAVEGPYKQIADGAPQTPTTPPANPAIINSLASNDDSDVATLARRAKKESHKDDGEVVISLH